MIEYFANERGGKGIKKISEYSTNCWVHSVDPNENEISSLSEKFGLNKENLIDGLDIHENPRVEADKEKVYIYLTVPTEKIKQEDDSSFLIIFSKNIFITISKYQLEIFDKILDIKNSVSILKGSGNILKLLFFISRSFETSVRKIIREVKSNKADLNELNNKDIVKLINYENKLNSYISGFGAIIQNYNLILRNKLIKFSEKDEDIIEDLIIDLDGTFTLCKEILKTISNMRNYYSTKLSNDLNRKVTLLTLFTIFLSIPTLISSIYGMNISLPFQGSINIFFMLMALVIGVWVLMFFMLKYFKVIS